MAIVDEDLERLRATLVLSDVVQQYVALRRVGRNWVGLCPFHAERTGSFNVRDETGRYRCFGCGAAGDAFKFVQEIDHLDFVAAVESLAAKANVQLRYTTGEAGDRQRQRRRQLIESMGKAVEWYHQRLLDAPDAREARDYLRKRGLSGDVARAFKLGWAPDDWDAMSKNLGVAPETLRDTGLAFNNKSGRMQDSFRARVLFPIYTENGDPVALGGRVLPGSSDPAKYKNSSETPIYAKSKTLYGLNWAKGEIVTADQVIVCEGYTDVIGFHRAGIKRAVATCGTALTEDHVRLLKRYATQVVLAFDADAAGQGAAQRFYEWEERYQVRVSVARFPGGKDPSDLSMSDPDALRTAVEQAAGSTGKVSAVGALPFLGFRVNNALNSRKSRSPEDTAHVAGLAMAVVNEHPNRELRKLFAAQIAAHLEMPPADLVSLADRGVKSPTVRVAPVRRVGAAENAEFVAVAMLLQRWDDIAPWLMEELFVDDVARRAFLAVAESAGAIEVALGLADPEAREFLERAAVADVDADPVLEARNLIAAATRRRLAASVHVTEPDAVHALRDARLALEAIEQTDAGDAGAEILLGWLKAASEGSE